jgi:hypothetical protein
MRQYFTAHEMQSFLKTEPETAKATSYEDTYHINHDDCGDSRARLYITKRDNRHLFYCHNCGKRGSYGVATSPNIRDTPYRRPLEAMDYSVDIHAKHDWFLHPHVHSILLRYLPTCAIANAYSLYRYSGGKLLGMTAPSSKTAQRGLLWATGPSEVIDGIPTTTPTRHYAGLQLWTLAPEPLEPEDCHELKWMSKVSKGKMAPALFYDALNGQRDNLLVIVEDPISAMCVTSTGIADALCLYGSNFAAIAVSEYVALYNTVCVWLDYDSEDNIRKSVALSRMANLFCSRVHNFTGSVPDLRYQVNSKSTGFTKHDLKNYYPRFVEETLYSYSAGF